MRNTWLRLLAILLAFGLIAAACGDDDDDATETEETPTAEAEAPAEDEEEAPADGEEEAPADGEEEAPADGEDDAAAEEDMAEEDMAEEDAAAAGTLATDLSAVCPSPLVVQSDWFPEAEHGMLYELIGPGYEVDVDQKVVRGPMTLDGQDLGIEFEVRTGGPAIGFSPVSSVMATDNGIHLGYGSTDAQILQFAEAPLQSVLAPLEINPQMIMWDPETYPEIETLADLGEAGVTINVFGGGTFSEIFVGEGIWSEDQVDPSYDGSPARFISENGAIAQQGFASAEVYTYENVFEEWGKPVAFELLHDAGFQVYSQTIAIRPGQIDELRPCLELAVPIMQAAIVSYANDPAEANATIVDAVEQYNDTWVYTPELAEFSIGIQSELGLVGNGSDDTVGNIEEERIQGMIDKITAAGLDVPEGLTPADIFTNEFVDESIGF